MAHKDYIGALIAECIGDVAIELPAEVDKETASTATILQSALPSLASHCHKLKKSDDLQDLFDFYRHRAVGSLLYTAYNRFESDDYDVNDPTLQLVHAAAEAIIDQHTYTADELPAITINFADKQRQPKRLPPPRKKNNNDDKEPDGDPGHIGKLTTAATVANEVKDKYAEFQEYFTKVIQENEEVFQPIVDRIGRLPQSMDFHHILHATARYGRISGYHSTRAVNLVVRVIQHPRMIEGYLAKIEFYDELGVFYRTCKLTQIH